MLNCQDDQRRELVREQAGWNGIDFVEVDQAGTTLSVFFLGKAPAGIDTANIRVDGGRTARYQVHVVSTELRTETDPRLDDRLLVRIDHPGDFSVYTLRLVGLENIDPRYDRAEFSFRIDCPSDLDCAAACPSDAPVYPSPVIDYLAKDYASFRQLILDRLALIMPDWQETAVPDLGVTLIELLAYVGDQLSYYQDAVGTEAYLDTARRRPSVRRHAKLVDYTLSEGCNARAFVCIDAGSDIVCKPEDVRFITSLNDFLPVPGKAALRPADIAGLAPDGYETFEPMGRQAPVQIWAANSTLRIYAWGDRECCIRRGSRSAALIGLLASAQTASTASHDGPATPSPFVHLAPGDVIVFEEVIGPRTCDPADADPTHRQAVRLTAVTQSRDLITGTDIIEIDWGEEDALRFDLCLSAIGPAPDCALLIDVSVARGNVVLVDHGLTTGPEDLGTVPELPVELCCDCLGVPGDITAMPGRFRPRLTEAPLTFAAHAPPTASAAALMTQDPANALPAIHVTAGGLDWTPVADLLDSGPDDTAFVVEMEEDGTAILRFGDGELGAAPDAGTSFSASYRVGNGTSGNVGAGSIAALVHRDSDLSNDIARVWNPLPAAGGTAPEPMAEAKLNAPYAFRIGNQALRRAITAEDYAAIAERDPRLQRAAARLVWTGSWFEAEVAVDPDAAYINQTAVIGETIEHYLEGFRRLGHDLDTRPGILVPIVLGLKVCVDPAYLRGHVRAALLDTFSNRRLRDGTLGYFHPDRLSFGDSLYLSAIITRAQSVSGVVSVEVTALHRQFEPPNQEIENGLLPLGPFEIARLDNDPNDPASGRLDIQLIGGR